MWLAVKCWAGPSLQPQEISWERPSGEGQAGLTWETKLPSPSRLLPPNTLGPQDPSCFPHFLTPRFPGLSREIMLQVPKS